MEALVRDMAANGMVNEKAPHNGHNACHRGCLAHNQGGPASGPELRQLNSWLRLTETFFTVGLHHEGTRRSEVRLLAVHCAMGKLHDAAKKGNLGALQTALSSGQDIESTDSKERTCLLIAASQGHTEIVKYLVDEREADVDAEDADGNTALHLAAAAGHTDCVKGQVMAAVCSLPVAWHADALAAAAPVHLSG
ncbi:ANK_REP_REGION domain-containing protein [Haematococcus lacustris]|uniref:ANK_REP_REGION domain-containing protein n=1 Tax=Haematococcus lacustris TaxID=44745 RepID=A0A699YVU6_HAELA|nr:ANK_REP_REGION domain-containing protein [Haematococcus lacustris]